MDMVIPMGIIITAVITMENMAIQISRKVTIKKTKAIRAIPGSMFRVCVQRLLGIDY